MGKASSSKKVARAARTGGSARSSRSRKIGFPLAIVAIGVLGLLLVIFIRSGVQSDADVKPRVGGLDHWHEAYGVYLCDKFASPLTDAREDKLGIHTHADGLIHVHPFSSAAAGTNATFQQFADQVGLELGDGQFTMPDGKTYKTGGKCGSKVATVRMLKWAAGDFEGKPTVITKDFGKVRFLGNGEAYVLVYAPKGAKIPLPESLTSLANPGDVAPGDTTPPISVPAGAVSTTAPVGAVSTTAPAETATTTAPASSPTTTPG